MKKYAKSTHKKQSIPASERDKTLKGQIQFKFNPKKILSLRLAEYYELLKGCYSDPYWAYEFYNVSVDDKSYDEDDWTYYYKVGDKVVPVKMAKKYNTVYSCFCGAEFRRPDDWTEFPVKGMTEDGYLLSNGYFCKDRLCPMCSWRRSLKIFSQVSMIMNEIEHDYEFLFLTLTVPNCSGSELPATIDKLQYGFRRLLHMKKFKNAVKGYFKALEVTKSKNRFAYNCYHPHYHVILAVDKNYFQKDYVTHTQFLDMWRKAMKDPSITQVDIRRVLPKEGDELRKDSKSYSSAVAEVAKYSVKSTDYILNVDVSKFETDELIKPAKTILDLVLAFQDRRLCSFGGCFSDARKKLKLDDCEDGDLVHIDQNSIRSDVGYMIRKYEWDVGGYKLIEEMHQVNLDICCDDI